MPEPQSGPPDPENMQMTAIQATVRFDLSLEPAAACRLYYEIEAALCVLAASIAHDPSGADIRPGSAVRREYPTLGDLFDGLYECGAHL